jgi:hypothetical protein
VGVFARTHEYDYSKTINRKVVLEREYFAQFATFAAFALKILNFAQAMHSG